ncbi:MAG: class I SAM-dependent methyltransferase [Gemmatimonadaceae bacterium]
MKGDRPSRTAHLVALGRAMADIGLSHVPGFSDPTARSFLSEKGRKSLAGTERAIQEKKGGYRFEMARLMADMMALRTSAIDMAVRDAITTLGATQLVILGAGYDGRAWRLRELAGVKVFEVDHPATQGSKRTAVPQLPPEIGSVTFVSVDFEREQLSTALDRSGHDPSSPTCWIWEGVVMYLTHEAMRATLTGIAARSAPGSTLIVNYHTVRRGWFAQLMFRLIGEPQISSWSPEEMAADMRAAGYAVQEDSGMLDWNSRFANGAANVARASYMRIAVARK